MTPAALQQSARTDAAPPPGLSPEAATLWFIKANRWEEAHDIAQEIPGRTGSWLHGLLHLIEGDPGNAAYWFHKAGKPVRNPAEINSEWETIARSLTQ